MEIDKALQWLAEASKHKEQPTELQLELIQASQRLQAREIERYQKLFSEADQQRAIAENRLSDGVQMAHELLGIVDRQSFDRRNGGCQARSSALGL